MKKLTALLLALCMMFSLFACGGNGETPASDNPGQGTGTPESSPADNSDEPAPNGEGKKVGFVTFGLGGDFFQMLADAYEKTMTGLGWESTYADGNFDPETQIKAAENYIAMGVDVLVIWSVAPEAMNGVIDQAMAKGIKVIAFVAQTEKFDAVMLSDDAKLAGSLAKLAAKWIDEKYADAPDHSVPVAVFSCRTAETGVLQADVLLKIEDYSKKAKFAQEVQCADETAATGQSAAENLYTTNPEIKVFLTPHNGLGNGINGYFTGLSSPVTDYSDMGIFSINGDTATAESIKASVNDESPLRGTVMTGSVQDTANELRDVILGLTDGSIPSGHVQYAGTTFVYADTVDEYISTGSVKSVTDADFPDPN